MGFELLNLLEFSFFPFPSITIMVFKFATKSTLFGLRPELTFIVMLDKIQEDPV
jgi:hypothetical protein